jgi:hypothetical protein
VVVVPAVATLAAVAVEVIVITEKLLLEDLADRKLFNQYFQSDFKSKD